MVFLFPSNTFLGSFACRSIGRSIIVEKYGSECCVVYLQFICIANMKIKFKWMVMGR